MLKPKIDSAQQTALDKARKLMPGGSNGNTITMDVVIGGGRGAKVWDVSGNEYVDYALGSGPMLVGHAHPEVVEAVVEQVEHGNTFFGLNDPAIRLAEEIVDAVPCAEQVRFTSTGSEATFFCMRVARAYRRRDKILKFEGGYHGMNDYALMSMAPHDPPDFPRPKADSAGIPEALLSETLIVPFNDLKTTTEIIERHHDELAGVILEPVQRVLAPQPGFLEGLREVTRQFEVPLIFDEIVTGFRLAYGGAQEYYGVEPDLCAIGKVIGGGFPLAAVAGRKEIMDHFDADKVDRSTWVMQEGTLNGNPIAAAAGLATLSVLKREGVYERLFQVSEKIRSELRRLLFEAEIPAQVSGVGPLFDVLFQEGEPIDYRSVMDRDLKKTYRLNRLLLERGVYKNDTKYYVSTAHGDEEIELTLDALRSAIQVLSTD